MVAMDQCQERVIGLKFVEGEEENEQRHQVSLGEADDEAVPEQMLLGESEVRHEVMSEDVVESSGNALRCQVVFQDGVLVGDVVLESGVIDDADDDFQQRYKLLLLRACISNSVLSNCEDDSAAVLLNVLNVAPCPEDPPCEAAVLGAAEDHVPDSMVLMAAKAYRCD
ncbi:hypothetical protein CAPTEDRAFT_212805, partial [Capitella teleta]